MSADTPRPSRLTTEGMGRAPNRAMLRAVGFLDEDFSRPMIGVASLYSDITPATPTSTESSRPCACAPEPNGARRRCRRFS